MMCDNLTEKSFDRVAVARPGGGLIASGRDYSRKIER